ncbi:MAG: Transcriptional regulator KdgR [Burkholderia plantarii]|nr:MAG: Transcriptional regulator KdgR [Burkholderia plantarii]
MGLISLQRLDPVRVALPELDTLAATLGHTLALATPGSYGPTIVHIHQSCEPIHVAMRTGTVMSLLQTATGLAFAAWLPPDTLAALLALEAAGAAQLGTPYPVLPEAERLARFADVRRHGVARTIDVPVAGISAISAPVFDYSRRVVLALTAIGPSGAFDAAWQGPIACAMRERAASISAQLGYQPD